MNGPTDPLTISDDKPRRNGTASAVIAAVSAVAGWFVLPRVYTPSDVPTNVAAILGFIGIVFGLVALFRGIRSRHAGAIILGLVGLVVGALVTFLTGIWFEWMFDLLAASGFRYQM